MHRSIVSAFALLVCVSWMAAGAVVYDFRQTRQGDRQSGAPSEAQGKGMIDGDRSRVEFTGGNTYPPGAFIISNLGANRILFANPQTKAYTEMDLAGMTSQFSSEIQIRNIRTKVEQQPDHPTVSGFPTDHYRIETTYEITLHRSPISLTQNVVSVVEKWTTNAFGDVAGSFVDLDAFRTGNAEVDQILEAELAKVKGLPLRTLTTVTTSGAGSLARTGARRVQTSELLLSNVRIEPAAASAFEIPAGFARAETPVAGQPGVHMLSMEPDKQ